MKLTINRENAVLLLEKELRSQQSRNAGKSSIHQTKCELAFLRKATDSEFAEHREMFEYLFD